MTLIKGKPKRFTEYNCVLREIKPGMFVIVSFKSISSAENKFTALLRTKEVLFRTSEFNTTERRLVRESIDELLLTVNNHCNPDYKAYNCDAYAEELRRRDSLRELKKKFR